MQDISVVVPVYNGADMLESCVQSILYAGNGVAEIVVVDDGSTDDTLAIAEELRTKHPIIRVIHTENHGCYTARMTGIKAAGKPYIASVDVDDRYVPGALDLLAELLEKHNADIAMGSYREVSSFDNQSEIVGASAAEVHTVPVSQMWPRIMKWKTQEFVNYVWNKLYRRELFDGEFVEADGLNQGEDVLITCQVFTKVRTVVETMTPVYLYYQNPQSLTRIGFGRSDLDLIRVWDNVVGIMNERLPEVAFMAEYNRWRTDFTLLIRIIFANNKNIDRQYEEELSSWRRGLKKHWKGLISPHAMPRNREILIVGLRFLYWPTRFVLRLIGGKRQKAGSKERKRIITGW